MSDFKASMDQAAKKAAEADAAEKTRIEGLSEEDQKKELSNKELDKLANKAQKLFKEGQAKKDQDAKKSEGK